MQTQHSIYEFTVSDIQGKPVELSIYRGKVLLIVNTASHCGFTPQYQGLQELYEQYSSRGLEILGFPCNQFGGQEPDAEQQIVEFCRLNYKVGFPMFAKVDVNGTQAHPLFQFLKHAAPGLLGTEAIKWNFSKFLIDRNGQVIARYAPATQPAHLAADIEKLLAQAS
jgi:glutathione peroxidase